MITRRHALTTAAAALAVMAAPSALAQSAYPDKLIKMHVPAPAGGQTDVLARLLAQKIQASVGQLTVGPISGRQIAVGESRSGESERQGNQDCSCRSHFACSNVRRIIGTSFASIGPICWYRMTPWPSTTKLSGTPEDPREICTWL